MKLNGINISGRANLQKPVGITYATLNPADKSSAVSLIDNSLTAIHPSDASWVSVRATQGKNTGKWFFELTRNSGDILLGFGDSGFNINAYPGASANSAAYGTHVDSIFNNGISYTGPTPGTSTPVTIMFAFDLDARKAWIGRNNTWAQGNPATGSSPTFTWGSSMTLFPAIGVYNNISSATANFGASAFTNTVPSGFNSGWYTV